MLLIYLFSYVAIGFVAMCIAASCHVYKAYKRGYDIDEITKMFELLINDEPHIKRNFVIGLMMWPVRLAQFIANEEQYFDMYDQI